MKSTLFQDFDERAQEVSRYFLLLKNLEQGSIKLSMGNAKNTKTKSINNDLEKTLKATGFLLLYNLVESTMRNAITTIFDEFKNKNISFDDATDKIKKIIIKNFKENNSSDTLLQSINNISCDIISSSFDKEKLFSGNIDARKIRKTSEMYGFSCKTNSKKTKDGSDLLTVKTNRNDLAHGFKSFEEVGRDATADELLEIKKRVISYLKAILENIESYLSNKEYLK
ncbi:MAE_28990/MAE_18760 family HEPN-like nuclease [Nostoc sp. ChiSLP03a]|uniref:MAE_28990/MAE_18760 family HEPN-like nuclease n=1 Tax=Nostoc sp. ChiSLP03a TaxID=3075380 RepID=UPI002AD34425|nr:MAE_28990/MAE_18760 family HEPN-like nuclease [Nostoc sp. ChiSLP03a]MDZ8211683.1 MAE_28990/MAE_18760 family HEPN-like nuclease [Nostoc sp. ChiSLP03a]